MRPVFIPPMFPPVMVPTSHSGQGALEYLLLIGGGVLVALIVFLLIFLMSPTGQQSLDTNIEEYKKIDLCMGKDAACNIFLDWQKGLIPPSNPDVPGFFATNESKWRTLKITGAVVRLYCNDGEICDIDDFPENGNVFPSAAFILPVISLGGGLVGPCNVDNVDAEPCEVWPLTNICDPSDPPDSLKCEKTFDFSSIGVFDASITLLPGESVKYGAAVAAVNKSPALSSIQVSLMVSQVEDGLDINPGTDDGAALLSWYTSYPLHHGSTYQCKELELSLSPASAYNHFGCKFTPGCSPVFCPAEDSGGDPVYQYCQAKGHFTGQALCPLIGGGYSEASCTNPLESDDAPYTLGDGGSLGLMGAVKTFDISDMKGAAFLPTLEPTVVVSLTDFALVASGACLNGDGASDEACDLDCQSYGAGFSGNIELLSLDSSPGLGDSLCSLISVSPPSAPTILTGADVTYNGYFNDVLPGTPVCNILYNMNSSPVFGALLSSEVDNLYLGLRYSGGGYVKIQSIFNDTLGGVGLQALYFGG